MNRPFLRKTANDTAVDRADHPTPPPACSDHACCCSARPVIEALMPATDERPRQVELLLCGHHYRISRDALERAGAQIFHITDTVDTYLPPPNEAVVASC